jgi:exodeoxyribonuclease V gamma subunit
MFLDALLSAREHLHLCFVGRSPKDDSECAPSTALAELLDHVDRSCTAPRGYAQPRDAVLVQHPLQPWSARYRDGDDPRLFTFTRADLEVGGEPRPEAPWFTAPLARPPELAGDDLSIGTLAAFWWHPNRFFLQHVVRLRMPRDADEAAPTEPFAVDPLDRWRLQDDIVKRALRGDAPPPDPAARMRATGLLPPGGQGAVAFADIDDEAQRFLAELARHGRLQRRALAVNIDGVTIRGEIEGVGADAIVYGRMASLKAKDQVRAWLFHVLAAAARASGESGWPEATHIVAKQSVVTLQPLSPDDARRYLSSFVRGFRTGTTEPLPFFEGASFEFAKRCHAGHDERAALRAARSRWEPVNPGEFPRGDSEDDAIRLCWRGRDAFQSPGFAAWASEVWSPAFGHGARAK